MSTGLIVSNKDTKPSNVNASEDELDVDVVKKDSLWAWSGRPPLGASDPDILVLVQDQEEWDSFWRAREANGEGALTAAQALELYDELDES